MNAFGENGGRGLGFIEESKSNFGRGRKAGRREASSSIGKGRTKGKGIPTGRGESGKEGRSLGKEEGIIPMERSSSFLEKVIAVVPGFERAQGGTHHNS